MMITELLMAK